MVVVEGKCLTEQYAQQRPEGVALFERARYAVAGGVGHDLRFNAITPTYVVRAEGARKWDVDGNAYVDYSMGNAALMLGYQHPEVVRTVVDTAQAGYHYGNDNPRMVEWAELICSMVPSADRVRFLNSGSEATMLALRVARAHSGRNKVVRFEGHYGGWHDLLAMGSQYPFDRPASLGVVKGATEAIVVLPADLDRVEQVLKEDPDIAAVMLEPSGASWGTVPLTPPFNRDLRALTAQHGTLLIYDEVITGFRYSPGGYQQLVGVQPDLTTLGKIVSGGMPSGVLAGRAELMRLHEQTGDPHHDRFARVWHQGTFNASPLAAAAGIATLKLLRDGTAIAHANRMATRLRDGMERILNEEGIAAYAYGEASVFHVHLRPAELGPVKSRDVLRTTDAAILKGVAGKVIAAYQNQLRLRGMDLLSYNGGVTSSAHAEADIDESLDAFRGAVRALAQDGVVARVQ